MIYSIFPESFIMSNSFKANNNYKEISYKGRIMQVIKNDNGYEVVRLISSNPNDYAKNEFRPGSYIQYIYK